MRFFFFYITHSHQVSGVRCGVRTRLLSAKSQVGHNRVRVAMASGKGRGYPAEQK